ncbi:GntR family transcriptional regulator [Peribacillus cavernae]|uniref:GntR family transcriptional regulator n=1 Tax=Peribacillus cavernae TaxID=1674310 RepID=A0A433HIU9_9BACI|nr:GntR family transcriptional regulator [Peribacillus cavernae]MDQ0217689.1 DNA-binding GntR family transcriptional regulator [Peribacillus cavernae]RUQ28159.1 GntR family transcriptional regulator [Peribacillus cavernae]
MEYLKEPFIIEDELNIESPGDFPPYVPLREAVFQTLKKSILNGSLKPGQLLSENKIADKLSVSRTPVREALRVLEMENMVSILPGRRIIVSIPTIQDIEEIYQIRLLVETEALRNITPDHVSLIEQLEACLEIADTQLTSKDPAGLASTNSEFHSILVSSLGNRRLEQFIDTFQDTIVRYRLYSLSNIKWAGESEAEHWEILQYLKNKNTERAIQVLEKHLLTAKEVLTSIISENDTKED